MASPLVNLLLLLLAGALCSSAGAAASYRQPLCYSWRFNVEVNNLRDWTVVPEACEAYVASYVSGDAYQEDSQEALLQAVSFAYLVFNSSSSASSHAFSFNAWVFDIDETSLSNAPYYAQHRFGAEAYNDTLFNAWTSEASAPALPATLNLFNTLKNLGYSVFFLTGRREDQRNATVANLLNAGFSGWEGLILRQIEDQGVTALLYKSGKRKALEDLGYVIVGNVGDQWSDLSGYSVGSRVFKLPNPMYYIA
ncbi:hypothetical protein L7F22_061285 [Adiantum nelumboides]|nr:hypothetical protein [Adiantum nelumboides]